MYKLKNLYLYIEKGIALYQEITHDKETVFILKEGFSNMKPLREIDLFIEPLPTQSADGSTHGGVRITHLPTKIMVQIETSNTYKHDEQMAIKSLTQMVNTYESNLLNDLKENSIINKSIK